VKWRKDDGLATEILADLSDEIYIDKPLPHVTELIYCLTASWQDRFQRLPHTPQEVALFVAGVGMEKVMLQGHRQHISCCNLRVEAGHPIESCEGFQGIHYDTDFVDFRGRPGEMKSTRKSSKYFPDEMPTTWRKQMLSYMKVGGSLEITLAAFHLMGNYGPPFPALHVWNGSADPGEIQSNWEWMQARRYIYMDHVQRGEAPKQYAFHNGDWECDRCRYKVICNARQLADEQQATA
jgi:hypothetical protein